MSKQITAAELMDLLAQVNPEAKIMFVYDGETTYDFPMKMHYDYDWNTVVLTGH